MKALIVTFILIIVILLVGLVYQAQDNWKLRAENQALKSIESLDPILPSDAAEVVTALQRLGEQIDEAKVGQERVLRLLKEASREYSK